VEGSVPSETKEEAAQRVAIGELGTQAILGSFARIDRKKDLYCLHPVVCYDVEGRMIVVHVDQLAPHQGACRGEWP
jgi:hypothetical protein